MYTKKFLSGVFLIVGLIGCSKKNSELEEYLRCFYATEPTSNALSANPGLITNDFLNSDTAHAEAFLRDYFKQNINNIDPNKAMALIDDVRTNFYEDASPAKLELYRQMPVCKEMYNYQIKPARQ